MENSSGPGEEKIAAFLPTGALRLTPERLKVVLPQWEAMRRSIRQMDGMETGETEPAPIYVWQEERP